jgi:hypothetical protein
MALLRLFFILSLCLHVSQATEWKNIKSVSLKKDQTYRVLIKSENSVRLLEFRWTLYINDILTVLENFDDLVTQRSLKLNHTNQSFRIDLLARTATKIIIPYLLIKFTEYDYKKNESKFDIFLKDSEEEIKLEYLKSE